MPSKKLTFLFKLGIYFFLPLSRLVVNAFTGDLALTLRANFSTKWLRLVPVRLGVVFFFGLPKVLTP
jgi:hypothetical protein